MDNRMTRILELGNIMIQINDLDTLMERILTMARQLVNADAGSIYKHEDGTLKLEYSQNDTIAARLGSPRKLAYSYIELPVNRSTIAGYVAETGEYLNIPDVYKLDPELPYKFGGKWDHLTHYHSQSMLAFPLLTSDHEIVGVLQLINALDPETGKAIPFQDKDIPLLKHFANVAAVHLEKAGLTRRIILRTISMAELRDPTETGPHANRVGAYSAALYEAWAHRRNFDPLEIAKNKDLIRVAAMLHDVGKVGTSDLILKKPGRLDEEERRVMELHTVTGARLLSDGRTQLEKIARITALTHHEKWDGSGYPGHVSLETGKALPGKCGDNGRPLGLKGEEIPIWGRVAALADVFDALSRKRVYKPAWPREKVLSLLREEQGHHFDPELIDIFFEILDEIDKITLRYPDAGKEA